MNKRVIGASCRALSIFLNKIFFHRFIVIFSIVFLMCGLVSADDRIITFSGDSVKTSCSFTVELANTPEEHSRGLMFRRSLKPDAGMLFIFSDDEPRTFWMKNTFIPLDLVFINSKLEVAGIHYNAKPQDETTILSEQPVKYVLEINAGSADQCKIKIGSKMKFKNILRQQH